MALNDYLNVWYDHELVGEVWCNPAGIMGFRYSDNWLADGFAISQQLPLINKEYPPESERAHQFFANLLPEGDARMHVVRDLKLSNSDYILLKAIGGECAGALFILSSDHKPQGNAKYKKLGKTDFKKLLLRKGYTAMSFSNDERPRLSLAGAQDKCPVLFDGEDYWLPEDAAPSTHILKFEVTNYQNIPAYECFLAMLAKSIGLPVAESELCQDEDQYYFRVKRYDRVIVGDDKIQRIHQEDFCQALGVRYENKYQQHGGPSFKDCYTLIQQVSINPIRDTENLLRWQIFNVLAGNSDGHAKNLSLIYNQEHQIELAPFYDLVCTRAIPRIDTSLAMSVGDEFDPDKLGAKDWSVLAHDCDIRQPYLASMIKEMITALRENSPKVRVEFESAFGSYPALQRVEKVVAKQCRIISSNL